MQSKTYKRKKPLLFDEKTLKAFTLLEMMIVLFMIVLLIAISVPTYFAFQKKTGLNNITSEIINNLKVAQSKTLSSEGASRYGVYFNTAATPPEYVLFKGENYASRNISSDKVHKLPGDIEIYGISLNGSGSEVVFNRIIGDTTQAGNLSLRLINNPSEARTVYIENSGQVGLNAPTTPSDSRITDSRHVHFGLGWSVQNATFLKFYFPTIPQTEQADMTAYFNIDKTEFSWEGTFTVASIKQPYEIHTHFLDATDTLLCIHRDRNQGKNNQEVIIYIVDGGVEKEIAHYLANGTVSEGSYGGAKEIQ